MRRAMRLVHVLMAAILLSGLLTPFTTADVWADEGDVADVPPTGLIQIWLTDGATGETLGGACYLVTDANGIPFPVCDTDLDGLASVGGLAVGEAFVEQTSAPSVDYVGGASGFVSIGDGVTSDLRLNNALAVLNNADDTQGTEGEGGEAGDQGTEGEGAEEGDQSTEGEDAEEGDQGTEGDGAEEGDQGAEGEGAEEGDQGTEGDGTVEDFAGISSGDDMPVLFAEDEEEPSFSISCFFSPSNGWTLTFTSLVSPTPASHTVTFTPTNRLGVVLAPVVVNSPTTQTFLNVDWRRIDLVYVYDGTEEIGGASCNTSNVDPVLTTTPKQQGGATVPLNGVVTVGTQVFDSSVLTNAHVGTGGTVTYRLYKGAACTGSPVFSDTVTVATGVGALTVPDSGSHAITTGEGIYTWQATYTPAPGGFNNAAVSTCGAEQFIYGKITPSIVTVMRNGAGNVVTPGTGSIQVGDTITDIANLTGQGGITPTGTVNYQLYSGVNCSSPAIQTFNNVPVGTATPAVANLSGGTYRWVATYSGDERHSGAVSGCDAEVFQVTSRNPTVTTTPQMLSGTWLPVANGATIPLDSPVRDNATLANVTANAGGTVTFYLWRDAANCDDTSAATNMGTVTVSNGALVGPSDVTTLTLPGNYRWQARYSGDANNNAANSACDGERFTINKVATTVTTTMRQWISISDNRVMPQDDRLTSLPATVFDVAILSGATADHGGTVTFNLYRSHNCSGAPVLVSAAFPDGPTQVSTAYTIPSGATGTYNWVAFYSGDDRNAPSRSNCGSETFHAVQGTGAITTQVKTEGGQNVADGATQEVLQQNRDSATLAGFTPDAGGTVTFFVYPGAGNCTTGGVEVGTVNVVNRVLVGDSPLYRYMTVGTYEWQAVYSGDANNAGATSACASETVVVTKRATTTTTEMRLANDSVLAHESRTAVPFTTYDTAAIGNTESALAALTGTITYELFRGANCETSVWSSGALSIEGGVVPTATPQNITTPGTYNWVVRYSGDEYRTDSVSDCGYETFYAAASPTLTTSHYDDGGVVAGPVALGSVVHDTASLSSNRSDDATGTVTFELWFGAACDGTLVHSFAPVDVAANGTIPASDGFTVNYSGAYYWVARYSGNNTNMPTVSDCTAETFTVSAGTGQITTEMFRGTSAGSQDTAIPAGGYVQTPFFASDRTAIINTPLDIRGQVSYQLVRGTTAVEACTTYEAVGSPQIFAVSDITAIPNAAAVQISTPGVYNWIVTFTPDGGGSPIVSGCGAETFIAFAEVERTIKITCTYFPTSKTTSYLVEVPKLTPDAPDYHPGANGLTAVAVPLLLDNTNGSGITYHNYNSSIGANNPRAQFTRQPWRELRVDVVFPDGVTGWAEADCGSSIKLNPTITTTIKNAQGDVIPNGTNLTQLPTQVRDTAVLTGATVDFGGTFTYKLYNGAGCTGTPVINVKTVTNPGQAPDSDLFSLASDGQYRFIVEYSGDAHNSPAVSRCQEEFFSINDGPTPLQPTVTGNECVAGVYQEPTVVITNGNGFTYEVTSQPTMVGNVWYYTVTATLSGDETIGDVAGTGWVKTGDKTATFDGEIAHTPCVVLEPAAPTFEGNVCENDVYTEPTVILPEDENGVIAYALVTAPTSGNHGFYSIRATIDVDGYAWGDLPAGWTIDPQDPTIAVFEGNLPLDLCVEETQPVAPTVDGNECFAGVFVEPSVVVATTPYHILYVVVSQQIVDDTFVFMVSATIIDDHYIFGQLPAGWELDENDSSVAIYEGEIELEPCIPVDLETPEVAGNGCEGGEYSEPSVVEPAGSEYLTYEVIFEDIDYTNNTFTYTVRATILDDSHGWATPPGEGWTRIDALIAEYTETIELKPCLEVELGAPQVADNACVDGVFLEPRVILPLDDETQGLTYTIVSAEIDYATATFTYTVRATIVGDGYGWADPPGEGWTEVDSLNAEFTGSVMINECIPVLPGTPYVEGNTCIAGVFTPPTVSATAVQGITYEITQPSAANNWTYTIVATIVDERMGWSVFSNSVWELVDSLNATTSGTVTPNLCEEIDPIAPTVSGNTCIAGVFTPPSVITATTPTGISYVLTTPPTAGNNWTYTVTATITVNGVEWGDLDGWVETGPTTATYTDTIEAKECAPTDPVAPTIADNTCLAGVFSPPRVVVATTPAGINYAVTTAPAAGNNWTYTVTATITIDGVAWGNLNGWTRVNATTATYTRTIEANECKAIAPIAPVYVDNVCIAGVYHPPRVFTSGLPDGISYVLTTPPTAGNNWTYTVTVTIDIDGVEWGNLTGWIKTSATTATYTFTIEARDCGPVVPVTPTISGNTCLAGVFTPPSVDVATTPAGITYVVTTPPTEANGWTYLVTATIALNGIAWGDFPGGWERVNETTATYEGTIDINECEEIAPVAPTVADNTCIAGVFSPPRVVVATTPAGISYVVTTPPTTGNNWTYTVTATIDIDGVEWRDLSGWVETSPTTATYTRTVEANECEEIAPVAPTISDNTCLAGVFTLPKVDLPSGPAGISYVLTTPPSKENNWTYTITATIDVDGVEWGNLTGWVETSPTTATHTRTIEANECEAIAPVAPIVVDNTCIAGVFSPPRVSMSALPDGISYALTTPPTAGNNWTYTVTATIDVNGVEWGDLTGWIETSATTATYTRTIEANNCAPIAPVAPTISGNTCLAGVFTPPSVDVATTPAGITYVVTTPPTKANGWTYLVTATIAVNGVAWNAAIEGEGWTIVDSTTATYAGTIEANECEPVAPATPEIEANECVAGVFNPPVVTVAPVTGIRYTIVQPDEENGWQFIVEAEITVDGIEWDDLEGTGWTVISPTLARFNDTVGPNRCEELEPAIPDVSISTCIAGVFTAPVVRIVDERSAFSYAIVQPSAGNSWTFTVTVSIVEDGIGWGDLAGSGWSVTNPTTAVFTAQAEVTECEPVVPLAPVIEGHDCEDGELIPPTIVIGVTPGIEYTIVQPNAGNNWTFTVTATIEGDGKGWGDLTGTGWEIVSPGVATYTFVIDLKDCEEPIDPNAPKPGPKDPVTELPNTGAGHPVSPSLPLAALMLMLAMLALTLATRLVRRQDG